MDLVKHWGLPLIRYQFKLLGKVSKKAAAAKAFQLFVTPQTRMKMAVPPVYQAGERLSFDFNGNRVQGFRLNHPSDKKLLILHGFESSVLNFDAYAKPLLRKGYEILAFDAPAHGLSEGRQLNAVDYKNFVLQIVDRYGPVTNFVTHSFGGLALSLALEELPHDERWRAVLIAPAAESTTAFRHFSRLLQLDENVKSELEKLVEAANNKPLAWYSVVRAAANINAQVLFLQDKKDYITPLSDVQPLLEKNLPNFRFVISEGLGHSKIYRDPGTVQNVVDFF